MIKLIRILISLSLLGFLNITQVHAAANVSVAFVLDESGSMSSSDFNLETQGFINALSTLPANGNIEVSIIGFASSANVLAANVELTPSGATTLQNVLSSNSKSGGGTGMASAIDTASQVLLNSSAPSKVICLATDGAPNSESSTSSAAASARNSGVIIAPIGVGLSSTGKTFLDSIASNPPVPNPTGFNEFGTVVQNVCIGVVQSALNLELTPDPVDFGATTGNSTECSQQETVGLINHSDKPAQITNVSIQGEDADQFKLLKVMGVVVENMSYPVNLPARYSTEIEVKIEPNKTPDDGTYDASLVVSGVDENGVSGDFTTTLKAPLDVSCMAVEVRDASPTIVAIDSSGTPTNASGSVVSENDVGMAIQNEQLERAGLVADGNARLFLTAKTTVTAGTVRFEILQPAQTEAVLHPLNNSPNDSGSFSLDVPIVVSPDGEGQATAILRAGERFLGAQNEPEISFEVRTCLLDAQNTCTTAMKSQQLRERRAPVVLLHGLWADGGSRGTFWASPEDIEDGKNGVWNALVQAGYEYISGHDYPNWLGPHETMRANTPALSNRINQLCDRAILNDRLACTKADLIGHSMGGLVARQYIAYNDFHETERNYKQGSVRRLLTLGTPHLGSGLANLLTRDDDPLGSCIRRDRLVVKDERWNSGLAMDVDGNGNIHPEVTVRRTIAAGDTLTAQEDDDGFYILESGLWYIQSVQNLLENPPDIPFVDPIPSHRVASAIDFLAVGNPDLNRLNSSAQDVLATGFIGNIGVRLGLNNVGGDVLVNAITYTGCSVAEIFQNQNTDGIVPVPSARGRLGTATIEVQGVTHLGMGKQDGGTDVVDWVIQRLQADRNSFSETAYYNNRQLEQVAQAKQKEFSSMYERILNSAKTLLLAVVGITPAYAADDPTLQLSVSNMTPVQGSQITLRLTTSSGEIGVATLSSQKGDLNDDSAPFSWTIDIPNSAAGKYWYYATAFINNKAVRSNSIVIDVTPLSSSGLKDMLFEPSSRMVLYPGAEEQLILIGQYDDGYNRTITSTGMGTSYSEKVVNGVNTSSGNSPVFDVSAEGLVTAKQPGEAEVIATNSGISISRRILVVAASDTDADGDGLSDADEAAFGSDKYDPDSDNDGVWDNIEYEEAQSEQTPSDSESSSHGGGGGLDPTLIFLLLGSLGYTFYRRHRKRSVA